MTNTNNSNSNVITSTSSPSQQLQHPQNAPQQYGRVDLSPPSSSVLSHAEAGPTTTTVAVPAPKRELNIRSWFSSSSMASSSPPVASSSALAAGGGLTGDLLNIEGASSRDQQQQQRPISPPSGMTPPAPSKESINFPFPSSALIYFLISHIITIYCTFIGGVIPLYSLMALYGGCTNYTV